MKISEHIIVGKVADICGEHGKHFQVYKIDRPFNPFVVKQKWYDDGWHTKTIAKYADMKSVMLFLAEVI